MRSFRCSTKNFQVRENQENSILRKIRVCNACNESCCAARIETRSKRVTSVEIELALQLVACAASDAAPRIFKCEKIKKIRFCEKFAFATLATRVAARRASKPAQNVPRAWKLSWRCNWLHAQLPMQHQKFSSARKSRKFDFAKNSRLQRLQRELLRVARRNPLKTCHERGN